MRLLPTVVAVIAALNLAACSTKSETTEPPKLAFAPEKRVDLSGGSDIMSFPGPRGTLRGRTIRVGSVSDLILAKGEVEKRGAPNWMWITGVALGVLGLVILLIWAIAIGVNFSTNPNWDVETT